MRDESGQMYMRNRYYDPATGQFTQPDPIGLAGELNSYGFAAGDPVSYADPYGLKVCIKGSASELGALRSAAEGATGAAIYLDKENCISSVGATMHRSLRGIRNRLVFLNDRKETFAVGFEFTDTNFESRCENVDSHFCQEDQTVTINQLDFEVRHAASYPSCSIFGRLGGTVGHSGETIIAHELLGHAWAYVVGKDIYDERISRSAENQFRGHRAGGRLRCN